MGDDLDLWQGPSYKEACIWCNGLGWIGDNQDCPYCWGSGEDEGDDEEPEVD